MRPPAGTDVPATAARLARAKINLALHVTGRRADGFHLLDSLVVFADTGDRLRARRAARTSLTVAGPFAAGLDAGPDNLVRRAAALMPGCPAALALDKQLPLAGGIGGGSADAAAALRALADLYRAPLPAPGAVLALGADVPVCLHGRAVRMRGIGEVLAPVPALPPLWCVLVNPGVACPTGPVFGALASPDNPPLPDFPDAFADAAALADWLCGTRNDLEPPARALVPEIARAGDAVAAQPGCLLARMSGSGATVFGLFARAAEARAAEAALSAASPAWWCRAAAVAG
nr:4-(cytidine 5'-diphospho)-2-C-methyl-D-erythritol kinase [Halovulum marinum]